MAVSQAKRPLYYNKELRKDSYDLWPVSMRQSVDECSEAGFVYSGVGDKMFCFYCGVGICDLEDSDVVWWEHIKHSPHCGFALSKMGPKYVQSVLECLRECQKDGNFVPRKCRHALVIAQGGKFISLQEDDRDGETSKAGPGKCARCGVRRADTVFFPCGHVSVCHECFQSDSVRCPSCERPFSEKQRLFYS